MNIHIMPVDRKFTSKFIDFINKQYGLDKNFFYLYDYGDECEIDNSENVKNITHLSNEIDLSKICSESDKIVVHGLLSSCIINFMYYNMERIDYERVILVLWGGDIYNNNLTEKCLSEKEKKIEEMKYVVLNKIKLFMTFACADYEYMKKMYGVSGNQYDCLYPSSVNIDFLNKLEKTDKEKTVIQLGNSATFTNQHIEALEMLSKFKDENIEIICPLSYGDAEYRDKVICYGEKIFGKKFVPIINFMKPEQYVRMLNEVDIAIFNNNRQQATANIEIMSYLGKKIYIREDNSLWLHYVERDKCAFSNVEMIKEQSFKEFVEISQKNIDVNKKYFEKIWSEEHIKQLWDNVLYK